MLFLLLSQHYQQLLISSIAFWKTFFFKVLSLSLKAGLFNTDREESRGASQFSLRGSWYWRNFNQCSQLPNFISNTLGISRPPNQKNSLIFIELVIFYILTISLFQSKLVNGGSICISFKTWIKECFNCSTLQSSARLNARKCPNPPPWGSRRESIPTA